MDDYKQKLSDLLTETARQNASDLHIAVGRKPTLRIDGVLVPLEKEPITTPESAEGIISELMTIPGQKEKLMKDRQIDLAYSFEDKARFPRERLFPARLSRGSAPPYPFPDQDHRRA